MSFLVIKAELFSAIKDLNQTRGRKLTSEKEGRKEGT